MFPFAVTYARTGKETPQSQGWSVALHTLVCEIHCQRSNLPLSVAQALPLYEAFAAAILADVTLGGTVSGHQPDCATPSGAMEYAGVQTIGYRVEIDVKINPHTLRRYGQMPGVKALRKIQLGRETTAAASWRPPPSGGASARWRT